MALRATPGVFPLPSFLDHIPPNRICAIVPSKLRSALVHEGDYLAEVLLFACGTSLADSVHVVKGQVFLDGPVWDVNPIHLLGTRLYCSKLAVPGSAS